ncbi:hypothetical protein [Yoonia sp. BS5-3]|uniref:PilZ domain-containing protein n=1 Tax=Yoonia phaeophyticola TaxID=3137369 RepID=A0ABZ2V2R4_9RHOB
MIQTPIGPQKAQVMDVNNVGARIKGLRGLKRGDKVGMKVLNVNIEAVVQWTGTNFSGITFRPQINDDQVDTLRFRRDARAGRRPSTVGFGFAEMR